jgi:cation transport ATPase
MKNTIAVALLVIASLTAHAQYQQVNLTVFGMDCAPCAHAIHVSMKGIQGVNTVDVDLNTGLVSVKVSPSSNASMRQFNEAVEKNGFTHKDANIVAKGKITGSATALSFEVAGTQDRFVLKPGSTSSDLGPLIGKVVLVAGTLPQVAKGKVPDTLLYSSISEAQ